MSEPIDAFDAWMVANGKYVFGILSWGLSVGIVIGNAYSIYESQRAARIGRRALQWPRLEGVVIASDLQRESVSESLSFIYAPGIRYSFEFEGKVYESERMIATTFDYVGDEGWAQSWVDLYPVGTILAIYVNPRNPHESVVFPDQIMAAASIRRKLVWGWLGVALGLVLCAVSAGGIWPGFWVKSGH